MERFKEIIKKITDRQLSPRSWFLLTVLLSFGVVGSAALIAFTVDPYYRYRTPFFYDTVYYKVYATGPHLLKSQKYDLLMVGSSMTRNFFIEDINKAFGGSAIKLAAAGAGGEDICKLMEVAEKYKKKELKKIVLSLDVYSFNKSKAHWKDVDFMYRSDHLEDYRYLFSRDTFSSMFYLLKRKLRPKRQRAHQADRNRMFSTDYAGKPYGLKEVVKDARNNELSHHTQAPFDPGNFQRNFYDRLLPFIDRNPGISFTVYLPPYHIYSYCLSQHFEEADALIRQRTEVMKELLKRPHVTLHDFQSDVSYVTEPSYFSDVQHFSNTAARRVLKDLVSGRRRLKNNAEILANEKELRDLISRTMPEYDEQMKKIRRK